MTDREILNFIEGKKFSKQLWSPIGRAMHKYHMIEEGDRIAVGISGGKDSLTTLNALIRIQKIAQVSFEIIPIHIHSNTDKSSYQKMKDYCESLGLDLLVENTNLEEILFNEENPMKNPCFLCGRIRRGILYRILQERKINKLALGHHKDDIIETFLMNVFYQGNLHMMKPSYYAEEYGVQVIRPLAFVEEKNIIRYANRLELPVTKSDCPYEVSEKSRRLKMKNLIHEMAKDNPNVRSTIFSSIEDLL